MVALKIRKLNASGISQLADRFVKDPNEIVKVQQKVQVTVLEVDAARKRIALSMKGQAEGG